MKRYIFLGCMIFVQSVAAQSEEQIENWLYGLPIGKHAAALRKEIIRSGQFEEVKKFPNSRHKHANASYSGTIITPILPGRGDLDSAIISLNIGSTKSADGYSGAMKWIFLEYFSYDTLFLNEVFDSASNDLEHTSVSQNPTGYREPGNEVVGTGLAFVYIDNPQQHRSISVSRVRYAKGKQSLMIIYAGSEHRSGK